MLTTHVVHRRPRLSLNDGCEPYSRPFDFCLSASLDAANTKRRIRGDTGSFLYDIFPNLPK